MHGDGTVYFIGSVGTILVPIANPRIVYAAMFLLRHRVTSELPTLTDHIVALGLIGSIFAIFLPIAFPALRYTRFIRLTLEFVRPTRGGIFFFGAVLLIGTIPTVVLVVTTPSVRYASTVVALELRLGALRIFAIHLILPVLAIHIKITNPMLGDALAIALEIWRATGQRGAIDLIRIIAAIVIPITMPRSWDTYVIGTSELIRGARTGYSRTGEVGKWGDSSWTHALAVDHFHPVGTKADMAVRRTHANMRTRIISALVAAMLHTVSEYLKIHQTWQVT